MRAIITGYHGSIGSALIEKFTNQGWLVEGWDPRNSPPPKHRADALILAHGGETGFPVDIFEKNAISVGTILSIATQMVEPNGAVIVLTSRRAVVPTVAEWDYAAAKAAAHAYTKPCIKGIRHCESQPLLRGGLNREWPLMAKRSL